MSNWGKSEGSAVVESEINWQPKESRISNRFEGRMAMVTGASRGFGRLIALALAREGANIGVNYVKSRDKADQVVAEIQGLGTRAIPIQGDISKLDDVKAMAKAIWKEFGRCDVLINNAGETAPTKMSWRELDEEVIDETLRVDLKGTMLCTHVFGERMLDDQKAGNIVNIGSNVLSSGSPRAPEYAAAKYGILGLTKSYALALAPYVRVNYAGPGYMDTESLNSRADWTPERRKFVVDATPLRAIGNPNNLVPMVLFLASDDSIHMTGNTIIADGGFSMPGV
jgi:3-oxoacyl-[acyl-carrier protein] reductase